MWTILSVRTIVRLVCVAVIGLLGCGRGVIPLRVGNLPRPECPEGGGWMKFFAAGRSTAPFGQLNAAGLSLSPYITDIVEFHDCQQFIVKDRTSGNFRYTSLFAIFARVNLDLPYRPSVEMPEGFDATTMGMPMATIFAYDSAYAPLGIEKGFNCLYFFKSGVGIETNWQARVVPVQTTEAQCAIPLQPADARGTMLAVSIAPGSDVPPPVARWDWDTSNLQQYIGIRCGTTWCEVHPTSAASGATFSSSVPLRTLESRSKGWYDEQILTLAESEIGMPAQVSNVVGTFIPAPNLGDETGLPEHSRYAGAWQTVAAVAIRGNPGRYTSKFNLIESGEDIARNVVSLCYVVATNQAGCPGLDKSALNCSTDEWYARIVRDRNAASSVTKYFCVTRRSHDRMNMPATPPIPGVVRWRWLLNDETMWVRCLHGCCEVNAT